ncbi:MAG: enoyl-CoA hydratase/isomerase family protein [Eggerthellaceae bacterium]|jgi:enoyl-CoA hydratase/carnithine racemase
MSVYQDDYYLPEFTYNDYNKLIVDVRGPIHVVSFNNAHSLNAMSYEQMAEFNDYLKKVRMDPNCRVIVLTGEGKSFCAGFELNDLNLEPPVEEGMGRAQRDFYIMQTICSDQAVNMRACPQPIIGALKGHAIGGGLSLSCACDLRVLGESYKMQAGYLNIGLTGTDMSGSYYLPRIVGYARAAEALMTARRIKADELLTWGFANKVVPDDQVVDEAVKMAEAMCANSAPMGLRLTKESIQSSLDNSFDAQIKMENRNQVLASQTDDARRGVVKMNPKNRDDVKAHPENYAFRNL